MKQMFDATNLKSIALRNRTVRSATWEGAGTADGDSTDKLNAMMADLAAGQVGLIISSHAYVMSIGKASPQQIGIEHDGRIASLTTMTDAVHAAGGAIVCQLAHAGGETAHELAGGVALAPSPMQNEKGETAAEMTAAQIAETVLAFAAAARRAKQAGFDGVQIHGAHGYLISQFLSPFFNKRTDAYGGSLENRSRLLRDIYAAIRQEVGEAYPVLLKINASDFLDPGFSPEEMMEVVADLAAAGLDAVELSGGTRYSGDQGPIRRGDGDGVYYRDIAIACKQRITIPVILVGGIRHLTTAQKLLDQEACDYIALSRPLICQPDLAAVWQRNEMDACECVSCSMCFLPALKGEGIQCVQRQRRAKREARKKAKE